jgi:transposase
VDLDGRLTGDLTCVLHSAAPGLIGSPNVSRRRYERWPDDERERILAESFMPGRT